MTEPSPELELRPDRATAVRWSATSLAAAAAFGWLLSDSDGHPLAWIALTFAVVVAVYFVAQLVAPSRFRLFLDDEGLDARFLTSHTTIAWEHVHVARVSSLAGEPYLELEVHEPASPDDSAPRRRGVLLPVGCDVRSLHRFLGRRLGRGGPRPPRTITPIDLDQEPG